MKMPIRIGDVNEVMVAPINHGAEINLVSMAFYQEEIWSFNTKHGQKISVAT